VDEEEVVPRPLRRSDAGKGPYMMSQKRALFEEESSDEEVGEAPDLPGYFEQFGTSVADQIKICRAFASFLASTQPKKKKK